MTARIVAATLAAAALVTGVRWGTWAVGGSDSSCYAHQAERFASGRLQVVEPLALVAPWPSAAQTFTPAGHIPSPTVHGASVPICPVGLALAMAAAHVIGGRDAMFLVVPLFGALLVWCTWRIGARWNARVGVASALLTACGPAFLFQVVQPMSDVPAAALWLLALACVMPRAELKLGKVISAGLATSAAILMRPNLLPLGIVIGVDLLLRRPLDSARGGPRRAALVYAIACVPGCLAVAFFQQAFYGSPFSSGYGSLDTLFSMEHALPNISRYGRWFWDMYTPVLLPAAAWHLIASGKSVGAGFPPPPRLRRDLAEARPWRAKAGSGPGGDRRPEEARLLAAVAAVNAACYLPYVVFDDWWYLRFLLPAIVLVTILGVAGIDDLVRRFAPLPRLVFGVAVGVLAFVLLGNARDGAAFRLAQLESRYIRAGEYVAERLPANAAVITTWQSGSVRYYAGRPTIAWDTLDPSWLHRAVEFLRAEGREPFLLFERWEEQPFRERFGADGLGALDWPPGAEIAGQVRVYRPDDRMRYMAGEPVQTEYVR